MPITMYGTQTCDDTERTRLFLETLGIPFQEVDIDQDHNAEGFVLFINRGFRSTPTMVIETGQANIKMILTEPTNDQLQALLGDKQWQP